MQIIQHKYLHPYSIAFKSEVASPIGSLHDFSDCLINSLDPVSWSNEHAEIA